MRHFIFLISLIVSTSVYAQDWDKATDGLTIQEGLLTVYTDAHKGKVYLAFPAAGDDQITGRYIYQTYVGAGLGSNRIGLDRSTSPEAKIIAFKQVGERIIAIAENHKYRATADNIAEQKAVKTAFAQSAIWSGTIAAVEPETGRLLVDVSSLLLQDSVGMADQIKRAGQGSFKQSKDLSFIDVDQTLAFPINLEFDATVTFTSDDPGREINVTTPIAKSVTLTAHTTLMALPDDGFKTREFDERAAMLPHSFVDMSLPLGGGVVTRYATRHRLEKTDPTAARSTVKKPIVYYVDNATPEPIRSALIEGANWWKDAFDAAGFIDAYRVEVLPEDVHPLDARYHVISWVHRSTRGWSWGDSLRDPRTGEIIRGFVALGSLRVRQDIKIFEGLAGTSKTGSGDADDPIEIALARIRQLSAHEVGHTLGFNHNMGASSYMGRASVMDYPAPLVHVNGGKLDFSEAYGVGLGPWDMWTVKYLYGGHAPGVSEADGQKSVMAEGDSAGLLYVKDADSRPIGSGHIKGSLWDNGENAVETLRETIDVRQIALNNFGLGNLKNGERVSALQDKIVPIYLYHRYQLQAATKFVGGMDFVYSVKGDGRPASKMVSVAEQKEALDVILQTLDPAFLSLNEGLLSLMSPIGSSDGDAQFNLESFESETGPAFDHLRAAAVSADITLEALLHPARAGRLVAFKARNDKQLGLAAVLDSLIDHSFHNARDNDRQAPLRRVVQARIIAALITLASNEKATNDVRVISSNALSGLGNWLEKSRGRGAIMRQNFQMLAAKIGQYESRQNTPAAVKTKAPNTPPGSPIGSSEPCWHCN